VEYYSAGEIENLILSDGYLQTLSVVLATSACGPLEECNLIYQNQGCLRASICPVFSIPRVYNIKSDPSDLFRF
jgi:hypothetical protein